MRSKSASPAHDTGSSSSWLAAPFPPWQIFVLPPLVPLAGFGSLFAMATVGAELQPHGFGGAFVALFALAEIACLGLILFLIPWSMWRLARNPASRSLANLLLVLFAAFMAVVALGHLNAPTLSSWQLFGFSFGIPAAA